jgi:hypothetical protein
MCGASTCELGPALPWSTNERGWPVVLVASPIADFCEPKLDTE